VYVESWLDWITELQLLRVRVADFDTLRYEVAAANFLPSNDEGRIVHWLFAYSIGKWAFKNVIHAETGVCTGALFRFEDDHSAVLFKLRFGCSRGKLGPWIELTAI
jgi:hypothetical protein